jgi:hypothetical protein
MMDILQRLFNPVQTPQSNLLASLLLSLLVAFIVGQLNAWCYRWTHRGVSYSRTFTQALVLISIIGAMSMSLVAGNMIAAFGLLGGLALIRFRTIIRDSRDIAYVFLAMVCGMAAGFGYHATAILGSLVANAVAVYMFLTGFGAWHAQDNLLRFEVPSAALQSRAFAAVLNEFCRRYAVVSVDESLVREPGQDPVCQCAYKVRLHDPEQGPDLVAALKRGLGIEAVHLVVDQANEDVA